MESVPNLKQQINQRINQLQTQHTAELEKLYTRQAAQYLNDAIDRCAAQNDEGDNDYSDDINVRRSQNGVIKGDAVVSEDCWNEGNAAYSVSPYVTVVHPAPQAVV